MQGDGLDVGSNSSAGRRIVTGNGKNDRPLLGRFPGHWEGKFGRVYVYCKSRKLAMKFSGGWAGQAALASAAIAATLEAGSRHFAVNT